MADQEPPGVDASTVDAPARWSGSAAVPQPAPRRSRWSSRRSRPGPDDHAAPGSESRSQPQSQPQPQPQSQPQSQSDEWATIPAVDPWAGGDTPWDGFPLIEPPAAAPMPPTRVEPPPFTPPTRVEPPPATAAPTAPPSAGPPIPPPPIPPAPAPAPAPVRKAKKAGRLPAHQRPLPAPPPWAPRAVQRPLPPPPRRRRRWGRRLAVLSLLGVFCCCGLPFAYFQFPAARQYPVTAVLPTSFADLRLRDDGSSRQAAERLADQLRNADAGADDVFAGVYADGRGKRITVFGVTGWRFTPGSDVEAQLDRMTGEFDLSGVRSFDIGVPGAHERCGAGRVDGTAVVVCAWADHGSLATVLLTRRSVPDSADLVTQLREEVLTPG